MSSNFPELVNDTNSPNSDSAVQGRGVSTFVMCKDHLVSHSNQGNVKVDFMPAPKFKK